jgi:cell division protein FtsB
MKFFTGIINIIRNKYLIALVAFALMMLFFDRNDIFVQLERRKELNDLLTSKEFYENEIEKTKKELSELENDPSAVEKYARENFFMKRDNEDIFIVDAPAQKESVKK